MWITSVALTGGVLQLMLFVVPAILVVFSCGCAIAYYFDRVRRPTIPIANAVGGGVNLREWGWQPSDWPIRLAAILAFTQRASVCDIERLKEAFVAQDVDAFRNRIKAHEDTEIAMRKEHQAENKAHDCENERLRQENKTLKERPASAQDAANVTQLQQRVAALQQKCRKLEAQDPAAIQQPTRPNGGKTTPAASGT
jgi:hypothetical protein